MILRTLSPKLRKCARILAPLLTVLLLVLPALPARAAGRISISMWVYPIGDFSDPDTVNGFVRAFEKQNPGISVSVDYLDYQDGDDQVSAALSAGTAPDVVMEGPERLVENWGAKGAMEDLSDLWTASARSDIGASGSYIEDACRGADGSYYEYPLCMTAHCMAINYEMFEKAGALQYLDTAHRTWTTQDFFKACRALADSGLCRTPGVIYCGGQGGDQGTRALVTNLYGAHFTNASHTEYTINSPVGVKTLAALKTATEQGLLDYDAGMQAAGELKLFTGGDTAMTFAWNPSNASSYASDVDFTPFAMTFPTDQDKPALCGGIWGFGIFKSGDGARVEAAKKWIRFLCDDEQQGRESVWASKVFPVRASFSDVYGGTREERRMAVYRDMLQYVGDYDNVTPGWAAQRTVWWNMLQQVFSGTDPQKAADWYTDIANGAIGGTKQKPAAVSADAVKRVLFISSYSLNDATVRKQIDGIQDALGNDAFLHFEFMDSESLSDDDYVARFYQYIVYKYSHLDGLGAVIVGDDNALQLVIRYQNDFFHGIPVIYESVWSRTLAELADSLGMTGVLGHNTIMDNLDLAVKLNPGAARILAISDQSAVGHALTARLKAIRSRYAPMDVEILDTSRLSASEIAEKLEAADGQTILLLLSFTCDAGGTPYTEQKSIGFITSHAKTAVYTLNWLGNGSLGGVEADAAETGRRAGVLAVDFLNGSVPAAVQQSSDSIPTATSIDLAVLHKYGMSRFSLPKDTVLYNDLNSRARVILIIAVLCCGILLLCLLLVRFRKERSRILKRENELQKTSVLLKTEAEIDALTQIGNRRLFERELLRTIQAKRPFTLYIIDIDDFKKINDTFGHPAGDAVLQETGRRLNALKTRAFVPYRYGGDEFAVMEFSENASASGDAGPEIQKLFLPEVVSQNRRIQVHVSLGSADYPEDAANPEELIHNADKALYLAKTSGKGKAVRHCERNVSRL
ncbi:MAG: extracellular solute-binding protein [Oscillospiraceae bacterium]|nr:extracellular solute-binding protein [Oscillospiraceae bacterium]